MGLYAIPCRQCGAMFIWWSGNLDQRCSACANPELHKAAVEASERKVPITGPEAEKWMSELAEKVSKLTD
jgi:hypothetical protein